MKIDSTNIQILTLLSQGDTNKEVASKVCLSQKAVEKRLNRMRLNAGAKNTTSLIASAIEKGIILQPES